MKARYKEFVVEVVETNGGWSTIQFADGMQRKVRNGEWVEMIDEKVEYTLQEALAEEAEMGKIRRCVNTTYDPSHYVKAKSKSGHATLHNGDPVAQTLATMDLDEIFAHVATMTGHDEIALRKMYAHLNVGMKRMNLGNRLRAWYKKNTKTTEFKVA